MKKFLPEDRVIFFENLWRDDQMKGPGNLGLGIIMTIFICKLLDPPKPKKCRSQLLVAIRLAGSPNSIM